MHFIYLIKQPLVPRDAERYGIDFFMARGERVTVFDLSTLLHPQLSNDRSGELSIPGLEIEHVSTWREFYALEPRFRACDLVFFFIQSFGLSAATLRPLRTLRRAAVPYAIQIAPTYPGWSVDGAPACLATKIRKFLNRLKTINPLNSIVARMPLWLVGVNAADYAIAPSSPGARVNTLVSPDTKVIEAHVHDFDIFLETISQHPPVLRRAVFLDQYVPFHHDFRMLRAKPIDPDAYFSGLCQVFDRIENELGLEVVIAAHPRANYDPMSDCFGARQIVYGETARLVCESQLVIAHNSVSVAFAVMAERPVLLLVNKAMYERHVYQKAVFDGLAEELGRPLQFFDAPAEVDLKSAMTVDQSRYEAYLLKYCRCPNAPRKPYWETVADTIMPKHNEMVGDPIVAREVSL